jgi:hypothetical protein
MERSPCVLAMQQAWSIHLARNNIIGLNDELRCSLERFVQKADGPRWSRPALLFWD